MANQADRLRHWPIAVTVSVLVHGAIVLAIGLMPSRQVIEAQAPSKTRYLSFATLDESDAGEIHFEEPRKTNARHLPKHADVKPAAADSAEPLTATLRDPWAMAAPVLYAKAPTESGTAGGLDSSGTSFFQVAARGQKIVYVLDISASMGRALATATRELEASVRRLPANARFQIIVYNNEPHYLLRRFERWLEPSRAVVDEVGAALALQVAEGRTDHELALRKAFLLRPEVVYFLTDADDLKPELVKLASNLNQGRAIVNTIEMNNRNHERLEMPLRELAHQNRGVYQAVRLEP